MTDETEDPTLPATRPTPRRDVLSAPIGHYPVEAVPEVLETPQEPYAGVATLALAADERARLIAELPPDLFDLLPSGEVFLPQIQYRKLLNAVFGPGAWGLRPLGDWVKVGNTIAREYGLYIRGTFVAAAFGEQDYIPGNRRMSWATAAEAAKSNALMRCCKDVGIASQAWDKRWTAWFQETHGLAVFVPDEHGKLEKKWRLKAGKPFEGYVTDGHGNRRWGVIERGPVSKPREAIPPVATATDPEPQSASAALHLKPDPAPVGDIGPGPDADDPVDLAAEMRERDVREQLKPLVDAAKKNAETRDAKVEEFRAGMRGEPSRKEEPPRESFIGVISDAQHKGLWAEAHRTWGDDCSEPLHALIERYGFKSTKRIKRVALPAIMQAMARIQAEISAGGEPTPLPPKPAARLVSRRVRR